jgi:coenzyme F420-dependent glucose-6-phosphate dehydrogenase
MTLYSYHVSQEQFAPSQLLRWTCLAEEAGFDAAFSSDHLQPWARDQGQSGFVWSWLGAALQATRGLRFGTITVPGGWRYQPVVLAQAIATLCEMFPGRVPWVALGSGEAVNECATGLPWPPKEERNQRLRDAAVAMRALLGGERVTMPGPPAVADARLWCRPAQAPKLVGAATSSATARWVGSWADGLLTTAPSLDALRENIVAFREGGGQGKPVYAKLDISWAPTAAEALQQAHRNWRFNTAGGTANADLRQPEDFEDATRHITPEAMHAHVFVSHDLDAHIAHVRACADLGVASIDLHNVGTNQEAFIATFGRAVLPALRQAGRAG